MDSLKRDGRSLSFYLVIVLVTYWCGCGGGDSGTVSSQPPPEIPGTGIPGIESIREEFLASVNQARAMERMCGSTLFPSAPPVTWNDDLAMAAYLHSSDMETNQFFSHTGSDGSSPGDRIAREGYDWRSYGENIAVNLPTVSTVMQGWLASDGHCRNIMSSAFREIGAAYVEGQYQGTPNVPYWTFDIASPM